MSRYREKTCPTCATVHHKRGPYCSRSCGNSRDHTDERREHQRTVMTTVMNAPDKAEHRAYAGDILRHKQRQLVNKDDTDLQELSYEDLFVQPVVRQLPDGQFVAGGDLWSDAD
jgi:hypothetical protein